MRHTLIKLDHPLAAFLMSFESGENFKRFPTRSPTFEDYIYEN